MKWMKERDLLIAQTMAFVQSVTGKRPEPKSVADGTTPDVEPVPVEAIRVALEIVDPSYAAANHSQASNNIPAPETQIFGSPAASSEPGYAPILPPPSPEVMTSVQAPRANIPSDYQNEIKNRVANFRAHQERFKREREAYFNDTFAKARALPGDDRPSAPRK